MSTSTASSEANKSAALEFFEQAWVKGDLDVYPRYVRSDVVTHLAGYPEPFTSIEQSLAWARTYRSAFPDIEFDIEAVLAEDDRVVLLWRSAQTHSGPYLGVAPLGQRITLTALQMFRFGDDGLIAEVWILFDPLNVMQQLGVFPPGPLPKPLLAVINTIRRLRRRRS